MAYSEQVATTNSEIPPLIAAFASARGWTVSGTQITRPGGGLPISISAVDSDKISISAIGGGGGTIKFPYRNGPSEGSPLIVQPTKIHLFGNETPWDEEPWIAVVVECGYNAYRHIYIGNMEKVGNYTGGEVIGTNGFREDYRYHSGGNISYNSDDLRYLFSAYHVEFTDNDCGGVNIVHADNATNWRVFNGPANSSPKDDFTGDEVLGGAMDSISSGLLHKGISDYAGSNILIPFNLYACDSVGIQDDVRFRPIGYPPGVRMINMQGLDPGQSIQVGNVNWRVFPEFSKRNNTTVPYGTSNPDGYYPPYETSFMLGLAYPEG